MPDLLATPETIAAAATDLSDLGATIGAANAAAAARTTGLAAAAADEVSTQIAAIFGTHASAYQALSTQVAVFHDRFVQTLLSGAASYSAAEAASASPLQAFEDGILAVTTRLRRRYWGAR